MNFKTWIDADSCPSQLREFLVSEAEKSGFVAMLVANRKILGESSNVRMIVCEQKKDEADNIILEQ
ncbi:MAG: DUF188 domain-containing protein, partial [Treponema sp.]|nr:DUF188 domain-containing protein [Treponema sp.]